MLNTKTVSLSFALTVEFFNILCAILVYLFPEGTLVFLNRWFHGLDLTMAASSNPITLISFLYGALTLFIVSYLAGAFFLHYTTYSKEPLS